MTFFVLIWGVKKGIKEYENFNQNIGKSLDLVNMLLKGKDYYLQILVPNLFQKNKDKEYIDFAKDAVEELGEYYQKTNSARIGYHYYYISLFYYELINNLPKALESVYSLLELVETRPPLHSANRIAGAHMQIAYLLIYLKDFIKSVNHALLAKKNYTKGLINELTATEVLFFASYWGKDNVHAWDAINLAMKHPKLKSNKLNPAKWSYFQANLLFREGNYETCQELLMKNSELMKDKSGWLLGHKMLEILTLIELGYYDLIDFRIESFRKLLQRQKKGNIIRIKAIVHVLDTLVKTGKNFKKTYELERVNLNLLQQAAGDFNWDPMGYELIRFDEWFEHKITKKEEGVVAKEA